MVRKNLAASLILMAAAIALVSHATTSSAAGAAVTPEAQSSSPPNVIFDTDLWADIDDMLALAMVHALHARGEINLVAVTISTEDPWSACYADLLNTFYGHATVPIGVVRGGVTGEATVQTFYKSAATSVFQKTPYPQALCQNRRRDGSSKAPEAVSVLRKALAAQTDGSVVVIQVGFSTNLARLLDSGADASSPLGGSDLVKSKVRLLSAMAGNFGSKGSPEFNLVVDIPSAQQVFERWPTSIVISGYEIGMRMLYPAVSIERDFSYVPQHPIAESYRYYTFGDMKWPHDHPTFDLTSVLYAARPDRNYFSLSKPGKIMVLPNGGAVFEERSDGIHRHLILSEEQEMRTLEAMIMLASQPPVQSRD